MEYQYDLIVIGAGPGGYPAALKAASLGKRVAVVEKRDLGGTCLNRGCIPTKTLLHTSGLYREIGEAKRFGIDGSMPSLDFPKLWQHKDQVIEGLQNGIKTLFQKQKIALYSGKGQVCGPYMVEVTAASGEKETLTSAHILLAAGSVPSALPIPGMDLPGVCDSDWVLDQNKLGPDSQTVFQKVVVIGGGVIGMEMATLYSNLGSQVTVLEAADRILPAMEKELAQNLKMILKKRGVEVHGSATVREIRTTPAGLQCLYEEKGQQMEAEADGVLVSVGRRPATEGLFAKEMASQITTDHGYLSVNADFETGIPGVYAIGDIIGGIQLAHMATAEGLRAVEHMFDLDYSQNLTVIPSCVYTEPEIACVGLTGEEAKDAGISVKTGKYIMSVNGKSALTLQERGLIKLVAEESTGKLLGAQLMCARATDIIGLLTLAISQGMTANQVAAAVMAHPTFAEGITEAASQLL